MKQQFLIEEEELFNTIGANLHTVRNAQKFTLEGVSHELDIAHSALSKIENGRYGGLSLSLLVRLCNFYQIPLQQIMNLEGIQTFTNSQYNLPGNHTQNNYLKDGYEAAIENMKEANNYLKEQNEKLLQSLIIAQANKK